jgi:hypothetical protein
MLRVRQTGLRGGGRGGGKAGGGGGSAPGASHFDVVRKIERILTINTWHFKILQCGSDGARKRWGQGAMGLGSNRRSNRMHRLFMSPSPALAHLSGEGGECGNRRETVKDEAGEGDEGPYAHNKAFRGGARAAEKRERKLLREVDQPGA